MKSASTNSSPTPRRKPSRRQMQRLMLLALPYKGPFIIAMVALAGGSGINLLLPEIIKLTLDGGSGGILFTRGTEIAAGLIFLFGAQAVFFYLRSYFFGVIGQRVVAGLRRDLFEALIHRSIEFFDRERVGDLVSRLNADTLLVQDAVSTKLSVFVRYTFQVAVGIVMMCFISLQLTGAILISLPILVFLSIGLGKRLRAISRQQQEEIGRASTIADEAFYGIRTVKAFVREAGEHRRYSDVISRVLDLGIRRAAFAAFFSSFVSFLMNAVIVLVLLYGIHLVKLSTLTSGELTAFLLYGVIVAVSFAFVAGGYSDFLQAIGSSERIFEILDGSSSQPLISESGDGGQVDETVLPLNRPASTEPIRPQQVDSLDTPSGDIEFRNISFCYPTRPEASVLDDVCLHIPRGKTTALVGPSGSGKSTIVNLILRFYEPTLGTILFDGRDIREIAPFALRGAIGVVPQEPLLFGVSIGENLRYGRETASQEEVESACRDANILDFIRQLPKGFDTNAGDRGLQLSAGQKQRISIARALLRNPALLILDEATSALDSESEAAVQHGLKKLMTGRTSLVIAHRLSTVKDADQVLVLSGGTIAQVGTHESLSRTDGLYRQLVERQVLAAPMES